MTNDDNPDWMGDAPFNLIKPCPICGKRFEKGQTLTSREDERVVHADCYFDPPKQKPEPIRAGDAKDPVDLCPKCGNQIQPEDILTRNDDSDVYYHVDCNHPHDLRVIFR